MAERSLGDPLSGAEIKEIIAQEVQKRLTGDCFLANDRAYGGFRLKFTAEITLLRPNASTLAWQDMTVGEGEQGTTVPVAVEFDSGPPDVERQNHDLPVPVIVQTPTGPKRQRVQIERKR